MRHRLGIAVLAASALLAGSAAAAAPSIAAARLPAAAAATMIVRLSPVTSAGALQTGYTITEHHSGVNCETGSEATGNGYRCLSRSAVYDPCWVTSSKAYVDCVAHPWAFNVVQLKVTNGYHNYGGVGKSSLMPWGVQLVDGTRCVIFQGAAPLIDHEGESYGCPRTKLVLTGTLIKHGKVWKLREAKKVSHGYRVLGNAVITTAWFGKKSRQG